MHGENVDPSAPDVSFFYFLNFFGLINELFYNYIRTQGYSFQVGYCETDELLPGSTPPQYTLYLIASSEKERSDWVNEIRTGK